MIISLITLILFLIIIGMFAFGGYYVYKNVGSFLDSIKKTLNPFEGAKKIGDDILGGLGIKGKLRELSPDQKWMNNCALWAGIAVNGNQWCKNDHGNNYSYSGREQADCLLGQGRGICKYSATPVNKPVKLSNNCVPAWDGPINGDKWCKNDFGNNYNYIGLEKSNCGLFFRLKCQEN